tara:strand:+ start:222 stop:1400 length:1179 start_codon:yes stop_codon:yes gene_type:complete
MNNILYQSKIWLIENLFSSKLNIALSIFSIIFTYYFIASLLNFIFISADWKVVDVNLRLMLLGPFPKDAEWRIWASIFWVTFMSGLSYKHLSAFHPKHLMNLSPLILFILFLIDPIKNIIITLLTLVSFILFVAGYHFPYERIPKFSKSAFILFGWAITLPLIVIFLKIFGGVETTKWGGYFLNIMLAWVGIIFGFLVGLILAIGRASSLPAVKYSCTFYIEVIRAAPLVAWLFFAYLVIPDLLPGFFAGKVDIALRVMIVLSAFTAAYIAEIIRGGLQSVPIGQVEASKALGMNTYQTTSLIVLPQAIRAVIPALVSQFIALWKDTTLILAAGLAFRELLGSGKSALAQFEFIGRYNEIYLFIGLMFWIVSFGMSRLSYNFEKDLGLNRED